MSLQNPNTTISTDLAYDITRKVRARLIDLGIKLDAKTKFHIHNAAGVLAVHLKPGFGQTVAGIKSKAIDMQMAAGVEFGRVYVDHAAGAVVLELSVIKPATLYTADVLVDAGRLTPYDMIIGKRVDGTVLGINISDASTPGALVAGATGAGKTALTHSMLATVCRSSPRLKVLTYDPVHPGLPWISEYIKGNLLAAETEAAAMIERLDRLCEVMDRKPPTPVPGRVLVYIDELQDLLRVAPGVKDSLIRLAMRGRNTGIHLLLATQNPTADALPADLVANMPVRIVLSVTRDTDSRVASGGKILDAHKLPKPGAGYLASGNEVVRFVAAIPNNYKVMPATSAPADMPAEQEPFDIRTTTKPDRREIQMQRDFALPAAPRVLASPKGENGFTLPALALPAHDQTIELEPVLAQLPVPAQAMVRPPDSYTLEERIALVMAWNPSVSVSALQNALRPGGAQGGFHVVTEIVNRLKAERGANVQ